MILYILLVVIAGLLGVIIALLPDGEGTQPGAPESIAGTPDTQPPLDGDASEPGQTLPSGETTQSGSSAGEPQPEPLPGSSLATETYPEDEMVALGGAEPGEVEDALWWLPEVDEAGAVRGVLYLILDDAGNSLEPLPTFLEFPGPMAVAVLPNLPYSVESAARTAAAGKEILLHQPMQAMSGADPGPGALTVDLDDGDVLRILGENLASVPGAVGVNNHMGSAATADARVMEIVLADVKRRDLFFVDSRTSAQTVASEIAANLRTPFAERHVFLDNDRSREAILAAIGGALELAHRQDEVVMIGHATVAELADVLNEIYPILLERGYTFGRISEIVRAPQVAEGLD